MDSIWVSGAQDLGSIPSGATPQRDIVRKVELCPVFWILRWFDLCLGGVGYLRFAIGPCLFQNVTLLSKVPGYGRFSHRMIFDLKITRYQVNPRKTFSQMLSRVVLLIRDIYRPGVGHCRKKVLIFDQTPRKWTGDEFELTLKCFNGTL